MKFRDMGISSKTIDALEKMKYIEPTEVQEKTIPRILLKKEMIVRSRTGTGKTAAFGIGLIELISKNRREHGLIMVPTRELAIQITDELRDIARNHGMKIYAIYGGQSIERQIGLLEKGFDIVVGTPGRMLDHIRRGTINLKNVNWVVLDEADLMLDMGFEEDINSILSETNEEKKMMLFSATIDDRIKDISHKYMEMAEIIEVGSEKVEEIEEKVITTRRKEKMGKLIDILRGKPGMKTLIFVATKMSVEYVCDKLNANKINATYIHGDKTQNQREKTINSFKKGHTNILVATDVAARGLHIENVDLIVNFDVANSDDTHRHRIGRTGRMGKKGLAITFDETDYHVPRRDYSNRNNRGDSRHKNSYGNRKAGGNKRGERGNSGGRDHRNRRDNRTQHRK